MSSVLAIKFRIALFGFKSVADSGDDAIFQVVFKSPEFDESIKTFEKACEEVCKDKQLKKTFHLAINDIRESHEAKEIEDLFKEHKFKRAVTALEKIYIAIYCKADEYNSEYQHFLNEVKRIAGSQLKEKKTGSVRMWMKIVFGAATAAAVAAAYVKKRNKEKEKEKKSSIPG